MRATLKQEIRPVNAEGKAEPANFPKIPIHRYIEIHAVQQPDAIALIFKKQQLNYEELNLRANQLAHYLINTGVGAEVRVAMCLKASLNVAVSLLAILKAGGVYVPLDPADPLERIITILEDNQPTIILTDSLVIPNLPPSAVPIFSFDRDSDKLQSFPNNNPGVEIELDQTAYLVYTSGTTGKPKGVMASHGNLIQYIVSAQERYGFNGQDIMPAMARFTFSISLFELLSPLVAGGRLLLLERDQILNFKQMAQILDQVTVIHASPSWWRKLFGYVLSHHQKEDAFQNLRHASSGGDTVPGDLLQTMKRLFPNAEIFVIYGCTEISCMGCTYPALRDEKITKSWLGKPFSNVEVRLLDSEQCSVPSGEKGEIYLAGAGVTKGYLNRPELSAEKFLTIDGQRFYRTGDLARFDRGNLEILGRVDFQIQLRGIRIEPAEIETHLRQAPGVREGVVAARELGTSEKSLVAYVVLEKTMTPDVEPIRQYLKQKLPDYMLPVAFVLLEAMPVNLNQKLDRRALPPPSSENLAKLRTWVSARDDFETQLVEIWENALDVRPIGIRNSFFELGGDSLQAVQILLQIEERWQKTLPITILTETKSIEALAKVIRNLGDQSKLGEETFFSNVVPLRSGGSKPPLFCLQGVLLYQTVAQYVETDRPVYGVYLPEEVELLKTRKYDPVNSVFSSIPRIASRYLQSIRSVQPHGPYYLAGSSFAGLIAFEMARQLRASKEEVALVAMFDSWMITKLPLQRRFRGHRDLFLEHGFSYLWSKVHHRTKGIRRKMGLTPAYEQITQGDRVADGASRVSAEVQHDILDEVNARAARSYRPLPYPGRLILFRATEQPFFSEHLPDLGWQPFAAGEFEVVDVPGSHLAILQQPAVSVLAPRLQPYLG